MRKPILAALIASSICATAQAGYVYNLNPGLVRVIGASGSVAITPIGSTVLTGCSSSDFYVINSNSNAKMMLSVILTAKAMDKRIRVFVPDDSTRCDPATGRPQITDLTLED